MGLGFAKGFVGHTSRKTTDGYLELDQEDYNEAVRKWCYYWVSLHQEEGSKKAEIEFEMFFEPTEFNGFATAYGKPTPFLGKNGDAGIQREYHSLGDQPLAPGIIVEYKVGALISRS